MADRPPWFRIPIQIGPGARPWIDTEFSGGPYTGPDLAGGIRSLYHAATGTLQEMIDNSRARRETVRPKLRIVPAEDVMAMPDSMINARVPAPDFNPELYGRPRELREPFMAGPATGVTQPSPRGLPSLAAGTPTSPFEPPRTLSLPAGTPTSMYDQPSYPSIAAGTPTAPYELPQISSVPATGVTQSSPAPYPGNITGGTPTAPYEPINQTIPSVAATGVTQPSPPSYPSIAAGTPTTGYGPEPPPSIAAGTPTAGYEPDTMTTSGAPDSAATLISKSYPYPAGTAQSAIDFLSGVPDTQRGPSLQGRIKSFVNDPRLTVGTADAREGVGQIIKAIQEDPRMKQGYADVPAYLREQYKKYIAPDVEYKNGKPYVRDDKGKLVPYHGPQTEGVDIVGAVKKYFTGPSDQGEDRATRFRPSEYRPPSKKEVKEAQKQAQDDPAAAKKAADAAATAASPTEAKIKAADAVNAGVNAGGEVNDAQAEGTSMEDYFKLAEKILPQHGYENPRQDLADANAAHEYERTALLAQLALAGSIVSGAGQEYEAMGKGFVNTAGVYDQGFQRYQQALQDSADRFAKQKDAEQTYDLGVRKLGIELYTSNVAERKAQREDIRLRAKEWRESTHQLFEPYRKVLEGDDTMMSPEEKEAYARGIAQAEQETRARGYFVAPGPIIEEIKKEVAAKAAAKT